MVFGMVLMIPCSLLMGYIGGFINMMDHGFIGFKMAQCLHKDLQTVGLQCLLMFSDGLMMA